MEGITEVNFEITFELRSIDNYPYTRFVILSSIFFYAAFQIFRVTNFTTHFWLKQFDNDKLFWMTVAMKTKQKIMNIC